MKKEVGNYESIASDEYVEESLPEIKK